jgi:hypothetical protein
MTLIGFFHGSDPELDCFVHALLPTNAFNVRQRDNAQPARCVRAICFVGKKEQRTHFHGFVGIIKRRPSMPYALFDQDQQVGDSKPTALEAWKHALEAGLISDIPAADEQILPPG